MNAYVLWFVSYLSLFISIFWINIIFIKVFDNKKKYLKDAFITILIPALNEEKNIANCVESIINSGYKNLRIVVIDDESKDNTSNVVKGLIKKYNDYDIKLIRRIKKEDEFTKAPALNLGIKYVKGDFVGCVDADSRIAKDSIENILSLFCDKKIGAVISNIKINRENTIWEKVQRLEYIFATFIRSLMSKIDTLHITPGALSVYRADILKRIGGFDEKNITEDLEVAMNIRYHGYKVKLDLDSITYTNVPDTFKRLWNQRVRWFRGFIYNSMKYKGMLMNKNYGLLGTFQYPMNIISIFTILLTFSLITYELLSGLYRFIVRLSLLGLGIFKFKYFNLESLIMVFNFKLLFPTIISLLLAFYIYHKAHKTLKEKWKYPSALFLYLFFFPILRSLHWVVAFIKEFSGIKAKW